MNTGRNVNCLRLAAWRRPAAGRARHGCLDRRSATAGRRQAPHRRHGDTWAASAALPGADGARSPKRPATGGEPGLQHGRLRVSSVSRSWFQACCISCIRHRLPAGIWPVACGPSWRRFAVHARHDLDEGVGRYPGVGADWSLHGPSAPRSTTRRVATPCLPGAPRSAGWDLSMCCAASHLVAALRRRRPALVAMPGFRVRVPRGSPAVSLERPGSPRRRTAAGAPDTPAALPPPALAGGVKTHSLPSRREWVRRCSRRPALRGLLGPYSRTESILRGSVCRRPSVFARRAGPSRRRPRRGPLHRCDSSLHPPARPRHLGAQEAICRLTSMPRRRTLLAAAPRAAWQEQICSTEGERRPARRGNGGRWPDACRAGVVLAHEQDRARRDPKPAFQVVVMRTTAGINSSLSGSRRCREARAAGCAADIPYVIQDMIAF